MVTFPPTPVPSWYGRCDWLSPSRKRNGVFYDLEAPKVTLTKRGSDAYEVLDYYGTVVSSGSVSIPDLPFGANFDLGTNGNVIAITDNFGNQTTPSVVLTANTIYSSAQSYSSPMSMMLQHGGGIQWSMGAPKTDHYGRFYYYRAANPSNQTYLLSCINAALAGTAHIIVTSGGKIRVSDGTHVATMTAAATLSQWVRIEYHFVHPGTVEVKLFNNPASGTPTETLGTPASWSGGAECSYIQIGQVNGTRDTDCWMDNLIANATSYPGTTNPTVLSQEILEIEPDEPVGGWPYGWYRAYFTGPETDSLYGDAYSGTNFVKIRDDARFVPMPSPSVRGGVGSEIPDFVMKGVLGLGTSRHIVNNAASPAADITKIQSDATLSATYQPDADPVRPPRYQWCTFPNGGFTAGQTPGVSAAVAALVPYGVTRFEGPENEPEAGTHVMTAATAAHMQAFQAAVHAGDSAAKAIGPCSLDILNLDSWRDFLDAGGGDYCDEISFHAYNWATNGDLNLGRHTIEAWLQVLADYGQDSKTLWQTESTHAFTSVYKIYHPRRARVYLLQTLLMEQYGIPWERNNWWYDISHGFWAYPAWIENADGSLNPQGALGRTLAEEIWGKAYASALDFGAPGNNMYLGNVYTGTAGSTVALMSTSFMDNGEVTLEVTGTSDPLTVVDGFGNATEEALSGGLLTVPLTDIPSYVELPAGVSVQVQAVNGFGPISQVGVDVAAGGAATVGGNSTPIPTDQEYLSLYAVPPEGVYLLADAPPQDIDVDLGGTFEIDRVVIWCGGSWQTLAAYLDFDVQTTTNGTDWTTRETVTKTASSFVFGTDSFGVGCARETFWDEQWVYDIPLPAPVDASGVRIHIRASSYGGEPDAACDVIGGQGRATQQVNVQEIQVFGAMDADTFKPRVVWID